MIVTGRPTSRASALAAYLARADWSQQAEVAYLRGVAAGDLRGALCEMEAVALGATCRRPLYHASSSPPPDAELTPGQWGHAVTRLEDGLRLTGQPRALVFHVKGGRRHLHAVWLRVHADSMRVIFCAHDRLTHRTVARQLEQELRHAPPRSIAAMRQGAAPTWVELRHAERAGIDPANVTAALAQAWQTADIAQALYAQSCLILARGDRGVTVVVDEEGGVYSVARRLGAAVSKTALRARLASLEYLPSVAAVRDQQYRYLAGLALGADLARQDREEADAPVIAAARAVLDRGLDHLQGRSAALAGGADQNPAIEHRHRARLAVRLVLAQRLVESLTDSPDGRPDLAQFVALPDELLWGTGENPELCVGPVPALLERLRLAGVRIEGRAGAAAHHHLPARRDRGAAAGGRPPWVASGLRRRRSSGRGAPHLPERRGSCSGCSGRAVGAVRDVQGLRREAGAAPRRAPAGQAQRPGGHGSGTERGGRRRDGGMAAHGRRGDRAADRCPNESPGGGAAGGPGASCDGACGGTAWPGPPAGRPRPNRGAHRAGAVALGSGAGRRGGTPAAAAGCDVGDSAARPGPPGVCRTARTGRGDTPDAGAPHVRASGPGGGEGRSAPGNTAPVQMAAPGMPAAGPSATTRVPGTDEADRAQEEATQRAREADIQRRNDRIAARAQRERDAQIAADPMLRAALAGLAGTRPSPPAATPAANDPQPP